MHVTLTTFGILIKQMIIMIRMGWISFKQLDYFQIVKLEFEFRTKTSVFKTSILKTFSN